MQTKEEEIDGLGCEFCGAPSTRMFKAPRKPIILSLAGRTFKAIKPYWLACSVCATSIETNNLDAVIERGKEAVIAMDAALNLPTFADKKEEVKQAILKMSFKLSGLGTIRKALELPSKPIDKPMTVAANSANTAVLDALKDATGSGDRAAEKFESLAQGKHN